MADLPQSSAGPRGFMTVEDNPGPTGPPVISPRGNPNNLDISKFLNENWKGILVGAGAIIFLIWLFGKK